MLEKDYEENCVKPFWSWNDSLENEELEKQIIEMKSSGIDGFFMHARGGLKTEYMSDEWFDKIEICLNKADELGMQAWAYDENGWPSGFADGIVPQSGVKHQQKFLKWCVWDENDELIPTENILALFHRTQRGFETAESLEKGVYVFYYKINPYYIDVFQKDTIAAFLKHTHERYYERFGKRFGTSLQGFFTDEPQYHVSPWSLIFPKEFMRRYGYDLLSNLPKLFFEEKEFEVVRNDYYQMVSKLFQESFIKQMYDWCTTHNCKLTGHMMAENNLYDQMRCTGGVMACYEYFHEPGMDHLGRCIEAPQQPKQLGSVAAQLGRKTLTETFALCGWNVSLNELKWIAQWQYVNGVTSLCPHLEAYSLRGSRKRDYPPSLFTQLPWFDSLYKEFAEYFTKLGKTLDEGKDIAPVLVIHPIHSAYILHNPSKDQALLEYSKGFEDFTRSLNDEHILHHYGDETILEHFGSVEIEGDIPFLRIGKCRYQTVLLPEIMNLTSSTLDLFENFISEGGKIVAIGNTPEYEDGRKTERISIFQNKVVKYGNLLEFKEKCAPLLYVEILEKTTGKNCDAVHMTLKRLLSGEKLLYLVNNKKENKNVQLMLLGHFTVYELDIVSGTEKQISTEILDEKTVVDIKFEEYGSILLKLRDHGKAYQKKIEEKEIICFDKKFEIQSRDENALTLDFCAYRIDNGEWQSEISVLNLHNLVLALKRPCKVEMKFKFDIEEMFDFNSVRLCMENPEKFDIWINEKMFQFGDEGSWIDSSIRKSSIGNSLKLGTNTIRLSCDFRQSEELYYAKFTPGIHESVLNKLTYDTELESIYLTGDFAVEMVEGYSKGERRCIHGGKHFYLKNCAQYVDITDITHQGFWFFRGKMLLSQSVMVNKKENKQYCVQLKYLNAPAAKLYVNEKFAGNFLFTPYEVDITELLQEGENTIAIQLFSGNRNVFGPHHRPEGESYSVGPDTFSEQHGWSDNKSLPPWTDNYNFVLFGCEF